MAQAQVFVVDDYQGRRMMVLMMDPPMADRCCVVEIL
jgi:hypothetical protein